MHGRSTRCQLQAPAKMESGRDNANIGFDRDSAQSEDAIRRINQCSPDVLVVRLRNPRQELWLKQFQSPLSVGVAIAAGGTIDFLAGR